MIGDRTTSTLLSRQLKRLLVVIAAVSFGLTIASAAPSGAQVTPVNGHIDWEGWSLNVSQTGRFEGLALTNVSYNGLNVLKKASHPVMGVYYQPDPATGIACGPYADNIGDSGNERIYIGREFTQNGERWLELGMEDYLGAYVIRQFWYLSENGVLDAHMFSKGLQCNTFHEHHPFWRLDFDIAGSGNDRIMRNTAQGFVVEGAEFDHRATAALGHQWRVADISGAYADIAFDDGSFDAPGDATIPETHYANNWVFGRQYQATEDIGWNFGGPRRDSLPYPAGESLDGTDVVFWYTGYMPHAPEEGPSLWHSTGLRISFGFNSTPTCDNRPATVDLSIPGSVPTVGDDVIVGTNGDDVINGFGGNDIICGLDGRDVITTGAGADRVFGGFGVDYIRTGDGIDYIEGQGGSDRIWSGEGDDIVNGGSGADRIRGGGGNDRINGQGGQDDLFGSSGDDYLMGSHQSDEIRGGSGNDELRGAAGKDLLYGDGGNDLLFGGENTDYLNGGSGVDHANGQRGIDNPLVHHVSGCVNVASRTSC